MQIATVGRMADSVLYKGRSPFCPRIRIAPIATFQMDGKPSPGEAQVDRLSRPCLLTNLSRSLKSVEVYMIAYNEI